MGTTVGDEALGERSEGPADLPSVTIVYVVYNRREELRDSLQRMLHDSEYDHDRVDVIVVDNASTDGSGDMVREHFPEVQLIARDENIGAPAWNDGFALAQGDYVLVLDDDCYLPPDGLGRAVDAAREYGADLVSFKVVSTHDPDWVFTEKYRTGLFTFWGCAWLISRRALKELGGYDPEIFMWANELEFMLRFYDAGYRHLHFPEVVAQHMKAPPPDDAVWIDERGYKINARHFAYVAAKLLRPRDAVEAFLALLARNVRDGLRIDRVALRALPVTVRGFIRGLRKRRPVRNAEMSRFYRRNFETFASPWWLSRPAGELIRAFPREVIRDGLLSRGRETPPGRLDQYYEERARLYPDEPEVMQF